MLRVEGEDGWIGTVPWTESVESHPQKVRWRGEAKVGMNFRFELRMSCLVSPSSQRTAGNSNPEMKVERKAQSSKELKAAKMNVQEEFGERGF